MLLFVSIFYLLALKLNRVTLFIILYVINFSIWHYNFIHIYILISACNCACVIIYCIIIMYIIFKSIQVVKTRLALGTSGQFKGIWDCFSQVVRSEGLVGLYRGLTPSLIGIIPYAGIDLAVYEV